VTLLATASALAALLVRLLPGGRTAR